MFDYESDFFNKSKKVAEDFLQSVVIVDDRADFGPDWKEAKVKKLVTPQQMHSLKSDQDNDESVESEQKHESTEPKEDAAYSFNAKLVIDSFAEKGIVCSVLRPDEADKKTLVDTISKLATAADIIILDWSLHQDNGKKLKEILKRIVAFDPSIPEQLRLIVIYTGNPDIVNISKELNIHLRKVSSKKFSVSADNFTLYTPTLRVTIFAKPETSVLEEYKNRIVSFNDLAGKVTEEFTVMTAGLVSNVVLESLSQIRKNTHKILHNFSEDLDAPYLTHRALLPEPQDAENHLTALVVGELQDILEEAQVGSFSGLNYIKSWLEVNADDGKKYKLRLPSDEKEFTCKEISKLLEDGLGNWTKLTKNQRKKNGRKLQLTKMFKGKDAESEFCDEKFAFKTSIRTYYSRLSPNLTLGTIIKKIPEDENEYLVCIQPRCDCIRIKDPSRSFPFLPFKIIKEQDKKFEMVVEEEKQYIRLLRINNPYALKMVTFNPDVKNLIAAKKKGDKGKFYFQDTKKREYEWIGELKSEHALRVANEFAANLSRIGLNESEWLRLWKDKG